MLLQLLRPLRALPPSGGDTLWCNLYAAHDKLSPALQDFVAGLEQELHPGEYFRKTVELQFGPGIYEKVAEVCSGCRHPLVRVHPETGRRALFLCGAYVRGLVGLEQAESDLLYGYLRTLLEDPNLQCRWQWQGSITFWYSGLSCVCWGRSKGAWLWLAPQAHSRARPASSVRR